MRIFNLSKKEVIVLLLCICTIYSPFYLLSQNKIDSLLFISNDISESDWSRLDALQALSKSYGYTNSDSATYYKREAYLLAKEFNNDSMIVKTGTLLSNYLIYDGDVDEAMNYLEQGLEILKRMEGNYFMAQIYQNLGSAYGYLGNTVKGLNALQKALDIHITNKNINGQALVHFDLGVLYQSQSKFDTAIEHLKKAKKLFLQLDLEGNEIICTGLIGSCLSESDPEQAMLYFLETAHKADSINAIGISSQAYSSMGEVYTDLKEYDKAEKAFRKSKNLYEEMGDEYGINVTHNGLGILYLAKENFDSSVKNCLIAQQYFERINNLDSNNRACQCLYQAYHGKQDIKNAYKYLLKHQTLKDSIFSKEKTEELTETKLTYEFGKEKEILAFQKQKDEEVLVAQTKQFRNAAMGIGAFALLALGFFFNARRKNQLISSQNEQLEQLNHTKDRIFAIIGHDLRKPAIAFRGITKKVNYLLKKEDYKTLNSLGNEIEKDAMALNKLTDNLLNWALMQKDVLPHHPNEIELLPIAEEVVTLFEAKAKEKEIALTINISDALKVFADSNALQTVIRNLVDNAIKYTPSGGAVVVEAIEVAKEVKIQISDTGVGMPEEKIKDIFLLKKEKSELGTDGEKGTGLGMHLANELVKLNKGTIKVMSQLNQGTTFEVLLPKQALSSAMV